MKTINRIVIETLLLALATICVYPFIYMFITSLTQTVVLERLSFDFSKMNFDNYVTIFKNFDFTRFIMNSSIAVIGGCILNVLCSTLAGYAFAKLEFKGRKQIFLILLMTLMIPSSATLIPKFMIAKNLGLFNTHAGLFLPIVTAFGLFLVKQFMESIPQDLLDSARIDGCSELRIFWDIILPISRPVIVSLSVFTFISVWNDFTWPLVLTTDDDMKTLNIALSALQGNYMSNYGLIMAGATLAFIPPFTFYIFLQKQFIEGIAQSGSKES